MITLFLCFKNSLDVHSKRIEIKIKAVSLSVFKEHLLVHGFKIDLLVNGIDVLLKMVATRTYRIPPFEAMGFDQLCYKNMNGSEG